jgi:outer membrane autotransporter protein
MLLPSRLSIGWLLQPVALVPSELQPVEAWRQSLPAYVSSCSFFRPPSAQKPYIREDHFSGGRPGSIIYGEQTASGSEDSSFHTSGLAAGIDTQVIDSAKAGLAVSLVKDKTTIGTDGSYNNGTSVAASLYASWKVDKDVFIDGQAGYGTLDYAVNRYDSDAASDMTGDRSGNMFFVAVTANYDQKLGALKYAPYAGFDAMAGTLNAYTESGNATYNLGYDSMYIKTSGVVAGVRGQYDLPMAWGTLSPTGRLQYRHAFGSSVTQTIYYDSTPATTYSYTDSEYDTDLLTTSLGLKATGPTGISGLIEYSNYTSLNGDQANGLRGMVIVPF